MFCPFISATCQGNTCVKWMPDRDTCFDQVVAQETSQLYRMLGQMASMMKLQSVLWGLQMRQLSQDPSIPPEIREEVARAKDADVVEKLLRDAGLI
ncbi:hypothetical protein LCGC14_0744440 [marine sediment metagenome]|uniref:Uncharacterized protein n=1 Tax=marine sediment metagenome TaxID=412755 RepID=A0A0F9QA13_9ZZZZ